MQLFWETSAVVPLVFAEPHSPEAERARAATSRAFAWPWMQVEAEAALLRRNATPAHWENLARLMSAFVWLDMEPHDLFALRQFNRPLGLRAADAGHLFVYSRAYAAIPKLEFVTFDEELRIAVIRCALPVWSPA
jgi:predicted nucleic acid-binding protein